LGGGGAEAAQERAAHLDGGDGAARGPRPGARWTRARPGACGAQDCQAEITRAACDHGQDRKNRTICPTGWVPKVNEVTTPKLPPAAARDRPRNRSEFWLELQVLTWPSAVMICRDFTLSLVSP